MGIVLLVDFFVSVPLSVQKPLSTSHGDERDRKGMQGRVKLPCMGYMRLLAPRSVVGQFMVVPVVTVSYCMFHVSLCKCEYTSATLLSRVTFSLAPIDHHRWAHFF